MASTHGSDASKSSLLDRYVKLCADMPREFKGRVDASIWSMLKQLDLYRDAQLILFYLPIHEELDTRSLIQEAFDAGKTIALPYMSSAKSTMRWYAFDSWEGIRRGARGVAAPPKDAKPLSIYDFLGSVCLVPGLVFDGEGYRIGYGAGYYDEFLKFYPGDKIGLVRSVQVSNNPLPHDEHDIPVDVLVTEGSIWRCRKL